MRVLFLTETIPYPLDTGGRIKTYHTLQMLEGQHEVHCHAFVRHESQLRYDASLAPLCQSLTLHMVSRSLPRELRYLARSVVSRVPFTVTRHFEPAAFAKMQAQTASLPFDAVYCDHLSMMEYGKRLGLPIMHDAHNVEYRIFQRYAAALGISPRRLLAEREWRLLERYERKAYQMCDLIFAVSDVDAEEIRKLAGRSPRIVAVPISVDAEGLKPSWPLTTEPEVLFVGGLHWPPNVDAVNYLLDKIWPLVRRERPDARLTIVGGGKLGKGDDEGVTFAGRVEHVEPYFAKSRVLVVPLRSGSGMRVKILDGFARGVPVVSTSVGAEGISAIPGTHFLAANDPTPFAEAVVALLADSARAQELAVAARRLVLEHYDRAAVGRSVLRELVDFKSGS